MRREAVRKSGHQVHHVNDQRRIMSEVGMQMVDRFFAVAALPVQDEDNVHSLKKTLPATARRIALIDASIHSGVNQRAEVSSQMQPGDPDILADQISPGSRLISLQIIHGRLNLVHLHLNNLLAGVGQCKNLDRYPDPLQGKDLIQYKGL